MVPSLGIRNIKKKAYLGEKKINSVLNVMSLRCLQGELPFGICIKGSGTQEMDFA